MGQALSLESFDEDVVEDAPSEEAFQQGYQQGLEAGTAQAAAETAALNAELVQNIGNIDFTYAEARGELLGALTPLLTTVVEKILPHCVAEGFAGQLTNLLLEAAKQDGAAAINLHIHPSQRAGVSAALTDSPAQVTLHDDPGLTPHAAWIGHGRKETLLDVDGLLMTISETLGAIHHQIDRTKNHG